MLHYFKKLSNFTILRYIHLEILFVTCKKYACLIQAYNCDCTAVNTDVDIENNETVKIKST